MELHALLLFLTNVAWICAASVFTFPDDVREHTGLRQAVNIDAYTSAERKCLAQRQVLYEADGECYHLLERGPCKEDGEVYVLDREAFDNVKVRAVCKKLSCPGNIFWPADGGCHRHSNSSRLCPLRGTLPLKNPFGEWECLCKEDPPHTHWEVELAGDGRLKCYELYGRGEPCKAGSIFVASDVGFSGKCVRDPCARHNTGSGTFAEWSNGNCYELGSRGPCPSGLKFMLHAETKKPECYSIELSIISLPPREAPQTVTTPLAERYVLSLLAHTPKKPRRRRPG